MRGIGVEGVGGILGEGRGFVEVKASLVLKFGWQGCGVGND